MWVNCIYITGAKNCKIKLYYYNTFNIYIYSKNSDRDVGRRLPATVRVFLYLFYYFFFFYFVLFVENQLLV